MNKLGWTQRTSKGSVDPAYKIGSGGWGRWQVKIKGRNMFDVFFRIQILRLGNWLDAGGEEEGRI